MEYTFRPQPVNRSLYPDGAFYARRRDFIRARVRTDPNKGCWTWKGYCNELGYAIVRFVVGKYEFAHRVSYEAFRGPIGDGLVIDHLCRTPSCINPYHLEPVTQAENVKRGSVGAKNRSKTHCPAGHPYAGDNLSIDRRGQRVCRACSNAARRATWPAYYEANREKERLRKQAWYKRKKEKLGVNSSPSAFDTLIKMAVLSAYVGGLLSIDQTQHLINRFQLWSA